MKNLILSSALRFVCVSAAIASQVVADQPRSTATPADQVVPRDEKKSDADEVIHLNQVQAYQMPNTKDLSRVNEVQSAKLIAEIRDVLSKPLPQRQGVRVGFVVNGQERDALRDAHAVLTEKKEPKQIISQNDEAWIVFFSHQFGSYVHLQKVTRRGNLIEIRYRYVPHKTLERTEHFALIPVGRLNVGKVRVEIEPATLDDEAVKANWKPKQPDVEGAIVSKSFSFMVE